MGDRLRILLLYETLYPATIGGIEQRNAELAASLAGLGHRVTLAGLGRATGPPGVNVVSLGEVGAIYSANGRRSLSHTLRFVRSLRDLELDDFDIVETANQFYLHLFPLARACRRARVPLVVTWYEHWGPYWQRYSGFAAGALGRLVEARAAHRGDAVAATCELTARRLRSRRSRVTVLPCGLDLPRITRTVPSTPVDLVFAGRLVPHKRVDLLLHAVARLAAPLDTTRLAIFGEGSERLRLQALANDLGLGDRVSFRGFVPTSEALWSALSSARLAVQPSEREGFGLFPLEALALGVPTVYCRSSESAVAEVVRDGIEGLACDPEPGSLATAIAELLNDPLRRAALAAAARRRSQSYDWPSIAERFVGWCHDVLRAGRSGRGDGENGARAVPEEQPPAGP